MDQIRPRLTLRRTLALIALVALAACSPSEASTRSANGQRGTGDTRGEREGYVDSALTVAEGLRRFREGVPEVSGLSGGASDRDSLILRFVAAVERGDTTDIRSMVLDRSEFAWVYYPSSPYTRPPLQQLPALRWFLMLQDSQKGITRVFNRYGGQPFGYSSHRCEAAPREDGGLRFWDQCLLSVREDGAIVTRRVFGSIVERDGHYKFLSYGNDF